LITVSWLDRQILDLKSSYWLKSHCIYFWDVHCKSVNASMLEMGHDPTQAYFRPAVNKGLTCLWPGYLLTLPDEIFWSEVKKLWILGEIFLIQRWLTWPNPTQALKNWPDPGQKFLTWTHHYAVCIYHRVLISLIFFQDGMTLYCFAILDPGLFFSFQVSSHFSLLASLSWSEALNGSPLKIFCDCGNKYFDKKILATDTQNKIAIHCN